MGRGVWILVFMFHVGVLVAAEVASGTVGYGRLQTALDGNSKRCFAAPGAGSKYRLGNECESWVELGVFHVITFDEGAQLRMQVRPLFYAPNDEPIDFFEWGEGFVELSGLAEIDASFWIGRRFYRRYDLHMSDFWYLNTSGDGLGIGDVRLGAWSAFYALTFDRLSMARSDEKALLLSHDLRLLSHTDERDIELFAHYMSTEKKRFDETSVIDAQQGWALGVRYLGRLGAQTEQMSALYYGEGLCRDAGAYAPFMQKQFEREALVQTLIDNPDAIKEARTWRMLHHLEWQNEQYGVLGTLVLERRSKGRITTQSSDWLSLGARPYWFVQDQLRLLGEVGYDWVNHDQRYGLLKSTIAVELAPQKGIWDRPVLRLFYTYASWSEDARGMVAPESYASRTQGDQAGVQLEYWW